MLVCQRGVAACRAVAQFVPRVSMYEHGGAALCCVRRRFAVADRPRHMAAVVCMCWSDWEAVCRLSDGFNGADMRNVCTEAGMFAIRAQRDYVVEEDFMKAARKMAESKKLESKLDYAKV